MGKKKAEKTMSSVINTRDFFLTCMGFIYLFAFTSLYHQLPGLIGDNGILPVHSFAQLNKRGLSVLDEVINSKPSLVWFAPKLGLSFDYMMDLIALTGILISSLVIISKKAANPILFGALYILYFSLYQVGQEFLWFQWDILLLEAGFLCIIIAPFSNYFNHSLSRDPIALWLVKWLLFRLMFSSGLVKLTSKCPTWWGLTALNHHFESQCLPTPLAWYAHQLPGWFLKLGVVGTYLVEIAMPFLFFGPSMMRRISFWSQILFQFFIILTGNYNFFNLLTIVLCLPLLQDSDFPKFMRRSWRVRPAKRSSTDLMVLSSSLCFLFFWTVKLFNLKIENSSWISSKVNFNESEFKLFITKSVHASITVGLFSLGFVIIRSIYRAIQKGSLFTQFCRILNVIFYGLIAFSIFTISLIPFAGQLDKNIYKNISPIAHEWHQKSNPLIITNSYGLFRQMTGVDGRPELIIEGSNNLETGWKEYHFLYKPGKLNEAPKFLIPHQPRLDWQMWFASLSEYENNPWLLSFIYRLITNEKSVINLIDSKQLPYPSGVKHVRVKKYLYHYTNSTEKSITGTWWKREFNKMYLPPVDKETISKYLEGSGIHLKQRNPLKLTESNYSWLLPLIRQLVNQVSPNVFIYTFAACLLSIKLIN
ncbi:lipase maturation factor 2-like [Panonychus citri]|uniref:lipase maturation factor 2-like n=1 Tax=Panonychus citri TaxID=50023 RepID=UPI0023077D8A|nr:lipase maturation factor 2-like [Panonychus citri]